MVDRKPETLLDGLAFGEGPRWHEDRLWFFDMHKRQVMNVDMAGNAAIVCEVPNQPSGLGWTPEGRLLVVSMADRKLLRMDPLRLTEVADLSNLATFHCNDMVVDSEGRAYVGHFGFDIFSGQERTAASLILVDPDGSVREVADELLFPNGTVITPDGGTLIVGETWGARLTAFDIADDGSLSNRRLWAQIDGAVPDGICLDAEGGIWIASPRSAEVVRILESGEVTDRIAVETQAFACMLGGPERKHLFICTAGSSVAESPEPGWKDRGGRGLHPRRRPTVVREALTMPTDTSRDEIYMLNAIWFKKDGGREKYLRSFWPRSLKEFESVGALVMSCVETTETL